MFADFLKLFEVLDIDGNFPVSNEPLHVVFGFMIDELKGF
jgi:hypothetical protein